MFLWADESVEVSWIMQDIFFKLNFENLTSEDCQILWQSFDSSKLCRQNFKTTIYFIFKYVYPLLILNIKFKYLNASKP